MSVVLICLVVGACSSSPPPLPIEFVPPAAPIHVLPERPLNVEATPRVRAAHVRWTRPEHAGTGPITGYSVTVVPGSTGPIRVSGDTTEAEVGALANGTSYRFAVLATNAAGDGEAGVSNAVTTPDVPRAPSSVTAVPAGELAAVVMWLPPANNGGLPVTSYVITQSADGGAATVGGEVLSTLMTNLTRVPQTFTVSAVNAVGSSAASVSNEIVPISHPSAPRGVIAASGNRQATVKWLAPLDSGGLPVTGYVVTASPGAVAIATGGTATRATLTGLTNGTRYTFSVMAQNALGSGPRSLTSNAVIPALPCSGTLRLGGTLQALVPGTPHAPSVADFDGDGRPDVVAATSYNGMSVLRGVGDGTFANPVSFSTVIAASAASIPGDFDDDGDFDLAVASELADVTVHLGNGNGTFNTGVHYVAGEGRTSVVAADLNQDGWLDLVTGGDVLGLNTLNVLLGTGDGTFAPGVAHPRPHSAAMIAVDLTGDGRNDLASIARTGGGAIDVMEGLSDAGFSPEVRYFTPTVSCKAIRSSDFNRDGLVDLAAACSGSLNILTNLGNGTFPSFVISHPLPSPAAEALALVDADFDGDGYVDLAVGSGGSDDVAVFLGHGNGGFTLAGTYAVQTWLSFLVKADFNGDGRPDLAAGTHNPSAVNVLLNIGDGGFLAPRDVPAGRRPVSLVSSDFNGDGRTDLAFANYDGDTLGVVAANGNTAFRPLMTWPVGSKPIAIELADLDGDGSSDLAVASEGSDDISVLLGTQSGALAFAGSWDAGRGPTALTSGDFNGDGRIDLAAASPPAAQVILLLQTESRAFPIAASLAVSAAPASLAAGDFNVDGRLDLAVATDSGVSVLFNSQSGLTAPVSFAAGASPSSVRAGDLNGDGLLDLVAANTGSDSVTVLLGLADGGFAPGTSIATNPNPVALTLEDVDADGRGDLVMAHQSQDKLSVMLGKGDGTFRPAITHPTRGVPRAVSIGDFDADGRLNVAAASSASDLLSVIPVVCLP